MSLPARLILLIDDSPEDRESWRRYLAADPEVSYRFIERNTIESGLAACAAEKPDCVLLDYHLPDGYGLDFLRGLQEIGGTLAYPTVMLTGTGNEAVAVEAMKAQVQDYLAKNRLQPDALRQALRRAVQKAETDRLVRRQQAELEEAHRQVQEAYREAQEANARKDRFLATLSHELRTPLTPILALVSNPDELARASGPELAEAVSLIRRNVALEARLIDDLLDITRITHGKLELDLQPVDVHGLIRHALDICRPTAQPKDITLVNELLAAHSTVRADAARLQQVFWNLLNNAIKFTPRGGRVRIGTGNPAEGRLEIEVTDTGMGITPDKLESIFAAFEQGDARVTREYGGLGLGLAICKALIDGHGGQIGASSAGLRQGATFRVELAAEAAPAPAAMEEGPGAASAATGTAGRKAESPVGGSGGAVSWSVLLVEDHVDSARVLSMLMRRRGYRVFHAATAAEAAALYASEPVDLIVSDLGLPDGSGLDLIRRLQAVRVTPSIILSGHGEADALASSLGAGVREHLTKPVEWPRLEAAMQRVLLSPGG